MSGNPYLIQGPALISFSGGRTSSFMLKHILDAPGGTLPPEVHVAFAQANGFESVGDMARFCGAEHPPEEGDRIAFEGVLIRWQPLVAATAGKIGTAA